MGIIETSLNIALLAYAGKVDKAGREYILHPLRVMAKMENETGMAVALLHDVLEDSDITAAEMRAEGIPDEVVKAVICLTKKENETYEGFIKRVKRNKLAVAVKIADIEDNINVLRLSALTDKDLARIKKYHAAWQALKNGVI